MPEWTDPLRHRRTILDLGRKGTHVSEVGTAQTFSEEAEPVYESTLELFPSLRNE